jgi:single-strand DNA-binding protein
LSPIASDPLRTLARQPSKPSQEDEEGSCRDMAASNINRVILTGNLTRDPELRSLPSGTSVCNLRVASNTRRKDSSTGEWVDKPNYFDVTVWGAQGENCAQYLSKGRPLAVDGRLEWREWQDKEGNKRQSVDIIADSVQFLGSREGSENGGRFTPQSDVPADTGDFQTAPASAGSSDDDIPF